MNHTISTWSLLDRLRLNWIICQFLAKRIPEQMAFYGLLFSDRQPDVCQTESFLDLLRISKSPNSLSSFHARCAGTPDLTVTACLEYFQHNLDWDYRAVKWLIPFAPTGDDREEVMTELRAHFGFVDE